MASSPGSSTSHRRSRCASPRCGRSWRPRLGQSRRACTVRKSDNMSGFRTASNPRRETVRCSPERRGQRRGSVHEPRRDRRAPFTDATVACLCELASSRAARHRPARCPRLSMRSSASTSITARHVYPTRLPSRFCTPGHSGRPSREVPAPERWWAMALSGAPERTPTRELGRRPIPADHRVPSSSRGGSLGTDDPGGNGPL